MSLDLTFYYADWCSHCGPVKPVWKELTEKIKGLQNKYNGITISIQSYEDKQAQELGGAKINDQDVEGYPTIKFGLTAGNEHKEFEYMKERDADTILEYVKKVADGLAEYKKNQRAGAPKRRSKKAKRLSRKPTR